MMESQLFGALKSWVSAIWSAINFTGLGFIRIKSTECETFQFYACSSYVLYSSETKVYHIVYIMWLEHYECHYL